MKTSAVFAAAKLHLAGNWAEVFLSSKKKWFICFAINHTSKLGETTINECAVACDIIHTRLAGSTTLEDWLEQKLGIETESLKISHVDSTTKMQVTRHAWLDSLIAEFQAKGD